MSNFALCTYGLNQGNGIDICAYQQAVELIKRGHSVDLFTFSSNIPEVKNLNVHILDTRFKKPWITPNLAMSLKHYDAVVSFGSPFFMMASYLDNHIMVDFGTPALQYASSIKEAGIFVIIKAMTLYSAMYSKLVLPGSKFLAKDTISVSKCKSMVSHSGIEFAPKDGPVYQSDKPYVLFVGRHVNYKFVDKLIRIFNEVKKTVPEARLITVGNVTDEYKAYLKSIAGPDVDILGYYSDVNALYRGATVYATCSLWEGEDRPALEAQSFGVPVVAWDNASHPEVVIHGMCVNTDKQFENALIYILKYPVKNNIIADHIRKEFSVESVVKKWTKIYMEMN